ncbi:lipase family protein [Sphingomonas sp. BN140010]|uniref:Lipase family protein n=1 Tax=Sphingomonas arvum TaxID=2992113 RepID=A0ABT3JHQ7_9SPHN|nr:lipase family protein [Sphingomonas sp. BN140010]MCW3798311.1 lipase family protein [Sphingomonas sp. BN140010]
MRASLLLSGLAIVWSGPALAQAGRLVAADPVANTPAGTQAWKVRYLTTDDRGHQREVSGMVVAPREAVPARPRPVIAWAHGTWGTATSCAPSLSPRFFELTPAIAAVQQGYVVVAPDYPGLGSAGPHPYLVGTATGRSVLDAVRAARNIPGAAAGKRFAVWGESQGGHAALWTGQLAGVDGAGLQLVGVAAGAPPTNLAANFRQASDANARAFLTALATDSWSRYYGVPLRIGARRTPWIIQRMARNCVTVDSTPRLGTLLGILALRQDLRRVDLATTPPWASYVRANSLTPLQRAPVLIAQTRADPLVAPAVTRTFARRLCANRVRVRWIDLPGKDHATTARQSAAATIQWISDRFAGTRAPSDCGRI